MATIQLRRGLQTNVAGASLATGEIIFTTDTGLVYVYDGTSKQLIGRVEQDTLANRPAFGVSGRLYYATDTGDTYLDTGTAWVAVGVNDLASLSGDLDDISDGTTYQRVAATEVDGSGRVTQVADGTNTVTAAQARSHIDSSSNPHSVTASQVGIDDLDDIADGINYQRVAAAEVDSNGQVTQVRATSGATNVTGDTINTHITGDGSDHADVATNTTHSTTTTGNPHNIAVADLDSGTLAELNANISDATLNVINDSGSGSSDLWSANKISSEITNNANGLAWKAPVDLATTGSNITLSGEQTIDGTLTSSSRVLVKDQTAPAENGIYDTAAGAWTRAADLDAAGEFTQATVRVAGGTANDDTAWSQTSIVTTVDTDSVDWVQTSGAGELTAGDGMTKTSNTLDVVGGDGITANADDIEVDLKTSGGLKIDTAQIAVEPADFAGTGLEDDGFDNLRLAAQGSGIAGGGGTTLSFDATAADGNGLSGSGNTLTVASDTATGAAVAAVSVTANGVGVAIDNDSIVHDNAGPDVLSVGTVDGGTF